MKKSLALFLSVAVFVGMFVMYASPAAAVGPDDNLMVHYDFVGATLEERLKDKAAAGAVADNLMAEGEEIAIADGIAYIPQTVNHHLSAEASADMQGYTDGFTVYIYAKIKGTPTSWCDYVNGASLFRIFLDNEFHVRFRSGDLAANNITSTTKIEQDKYYTIALTGSLVGGVFTMTAYISADGETWEIQSADFTNVTSLGNFSLLFSRNTKGLSPRGVDFYYDDIRVYNTALTEAQIKSITVSNAAESTSAPATTTAAPSTTADGTTTSPVTAGFNLTLTYGLLPLAAITAFALFVSRRRLAGKTR